MRPRTAHLASTWWTRLASAAKTPLAMFPVIELKYHVGRPATLFLTVDFIDVKRIATMQVNVVHVIRRVPNPKNVVTLAQNLVMRLLLVQRLNLVKPG